MNAIPPFEACFNALTGHSPMRWQARLFKRMLSGAVPLACDLPTGLGKTSLIPIWLIALASQDRGSGVPPLPRRLVYIVNRRTVVDQATEVIERMRERLLNRRDDRWATHEETLSALCRGLHLTRPEPRISSLFHTVSGRRRDMENLRTRHTRSRLARSDR